MSEVKTELQMQIESGDQVLIAEVTPPRSADRAEVQSTARKFAGKVNALGISDNRNGVSMSALAASSLVLSEGVEPVLHMITRDRNRISLISDCLGAQALGIRNILSTSGTHQTLGRFQTAKNVFDIDSTQLIHAIERISEDGSIIGEEKISGVDSFYLGAVASPFADPLELQVRRLEGKITAGAKFLITQPVFDLDRFGLWWNEITQKNINTDTAILGGIRILTDAENAKAYAEKRPIPMVPDTVLERLASKSDKSEQRSEGIAIALEVIERLSSLSGLRGFEICCDDDDTAILEVIEKIKN
jgi:methylenetetrahydrofolate reductase (NADPH)